MDCMEGIKLLDDNSIDLVVIDPPYKLDLNKVRKTNTFNNYANEVLELKDGFDLRVLDFTSKNCNYEVLTWHKQNPSPLTNNIYLPDTEYVIFAREKGVKLYGNYHTKHKYYLSGTNQVDKKKYGHPTIKPLAFIENHIENSSKPDDIVLDCFAGSGTTLVGAINKGRRFIGFEINKKYYEIAQQRIAEAIRSKAGDGNEEKGNQL